MVAIRAGKLSVGKGVLAVVATAEVFPADMPASNVYLVLNYKYLEYAYPALYATEKECEYMTEENASPSARCDYSAGCHPEPPKHRFAF